MSETAEPAVEEQIPASETPGVEEQIPANDQPAEKAEFSRDSITSEERKAILNGKGNEVFEARKSKEAEPVKAEATKGTEEDAPKEGDTEKKAGMPKLRITPKDEQELQFDSLRKEGKSATEAYREIYGEPASGEKPKQEKPKEEEKPVEEEKDPSPEIETNIESAKTELSDLEAQLAEAQEAEDVKEVSDILRKISAKEKDVEKLESDLNAVQQSKESKMVQAFNAKVSESADRVYEKFPVLGEDDSPERQEFIDYYKSRTEDPDYESIFNSPRWPEMMAREFADVKGLQSGEKPAEAALTPPDDKKEATQQEKSKDKATPAKTQSPAKPSAAKALTTGDNEKEGSFQVSAETYRQNKAKMTLAEKKALLNGVPVRDA